MIEIGTRVEKGIAFKTKTKIEVGTVIEIGIVVETGTGIEIGTRIETSAAIGIEGEIAVVGIGIGIRIATETAIEMNTVVETESRIWTRAVIEKRIEIATAIARMVIGTQEGIHMIGIGIEIETETETETETEIETIAVVETKGTIWTRAVIESGEHNRIGMVIVTVMNMAIRTEIGDEVGSWVRVAIIRRIVTESMRFQRESGSRKAIGTNLCPLQRQTSSERN